MKTTFPTILGYIVELTKFSGCYAVDVFGYSEHATRAEAIAAAKKRIEAMKAKDEEQAKNRPPLSERIKAYRQELNA